MGWVVSAMLQPLYPCERNQVPIVWGFGWTPGLVWMQVENLASTGIQCVIVDFDILMLNLQMLLLKWQ